MPPLTYVPNIYESQSNIPALLMRRGDQRAQGQADLWGGIGNAVQGLGAGVSQYLGQRQEQKAAEQKQAEMSKRDAAWVSYVESGDWAKDPKAAYAMTTRIWGPDKAEEHFKGLQGAAQLAQPKRDPTNDAKALGQMIGAIDATPEGPGRARLYAAAVPLAKSAFPTLETEDQYSPEKWPEISALGKQIRGEKPEKAGAHVIGPNLINDKGEVLYQGEKQDTRSLEARLAATVPGSPEYNQILSTMKAQANATRAPEKPAAPVKLRGVTSGDAETFTDLNTALDDVATLRGTLEGSKATGAMAQAGAMLPNAVTEFTGIGAEAKSKQATIDRVKQVIGKSLEGGVLRKEDEVKYTKILPTIGDPPEVVKAKLDGLEKAIKKKLERHTESLTNAGYDTSRFAGPKVGEQRMIDGQPASWDGHGWVGQ